MPAPSYDLSEKELIEIMRSKPTGTGAREYTIAKEFLNLKKQDRLVEFQKDLNKSTKGLSRATWVLAIATLLLLAATIVGFIKG